jgi:hypothetical protein
MFGRYMLPPSTVLTTLTPKLDRVCSSKTLVYSIYYGNEGALSINNTDHYIVRKLLDFNFNIFLVFTCQLKIQTYCDMTDESWNSRTRKDIHC